jgi:hypothetical protein
MQTLKTLKECPPDGFTYTHPETGHKTEATDPYTWVEKAKEHRRANGLPIPDDLFEQMQAQLCSRLPPDLCTYQTGDPQWVNTRLSWGDIMDVAKIYLEWSKQGKPFVSQEEAERRAIICRGCHLNIRVQGCGGVCQTIAKMVTETKGEHKTSSDSQLLNCGVCHCVNSSQVWFPLTMLEINDSESRQSQYPISFCWKNRQSPTYKTESPA